MDKKQETKEYQIPVKGSLGLLALGDIGLIKWREKKEKFKSKVKENKQKKDGKKK